MLFRSAARKFASGRDRSPRIEADARVRLQEIDRALMEELDRMRPFGVGNEEPVLLAEGVRPERCSVFGGQGQHLRATLSGDGRRFGAVAGCMVVEGTVKREDMGIVVPVRSSGSPTKIRSRGDELTELSSSSFNLESTV